MDSDEKITIVSANCTDTITLGNIYTVDGIYIDSMANQNTGNTIINDDITFTGISTISISNNSISNNLNVEGDITSSGKSIIKVLEQIEERLAILNPNQELEIKWEKLRDLRRQYLELEQEILGQEKVFKILGKNN